VALVPLTWFVLWRTRLGSGSGRSARRRTRPIARGPAVALPLPGTRGVRRARRPRRRLPRHRRVQPVPRGPDRRPRLYRPRHGHLRELEPWTVSLGSRIFGFTDASNAPGGHRGSTARGAGSPARAGRAAARSGATGGERPSSASRPRRCSPGSGSSASCPRSS
jgi:hypothetical protein